MKTIIVSRHSATVDYLKRVLGNVEVYAHADEAIVSGNNVYGNVPLHLAVLANTVTAVEFPSLPEGRRGYELDAQEVASYAVLTTYSVEVLK